jgi:hypothetical protein
MYTDTGYVGRGVSRTMSGLRESAAHTTGFARLEMRATLAGEPLYTACELSMTAGNDGCGSGRRVCDISPDGQIAPMISHD